LIAGCAKGKLKIQLQLIKQFCARLEATHQAINKTIMWEVSGNPMDN